jgi:hypothetical protein
MFKTADFDDTIDTQGAEKFARQHNHCCVKNPANHLGADAGKGQQ